MGAGNPRPTEALVERVLSPEGIVVAGTLSGTSVDGIDVALARVRGEADPNELPVLVETLAFDTFDFERELASRVAAAIDGRALAPAELARLDRDLGEAFARAVDELARSSGRRPALVGSHGQTIAHFDGADEPPWSLQLGRPESIAHRLGCPVVADFRQADVARGGEGAPLVPLVDRALFRGLEPPAAILNLGGIANLTLLDSLGATGFDVGPANAWLDGWARRLLGETFDADGRVAAAGRVHEPSVEAWLAHPYYALEPPKSTGRDTFGSTWLDGLLSESALREPADLLATAAASVAESVARALDRWRPAGGAPARLVLAGGGVHHRPLVVELARRTGLEPESATELGIEPDAREALAFALLAVQAVLGRPLGLPPVTGADASAVLGRWCWGS